MKKFIKSNIKELIAFTLGAVIFGTTVYAATVSSSYVSYSNSSSKLTSTNVQGAIDEISSKVSALTDASYIDFGTLATNSSGTILASAKGICIKRNNKVNCFKIGDLNVERNHMQQAFPDVSCGEKKEGFFYCVASDFICLILGADGEVDDIMCNDKSNNSQCTVYSLGSARCKDL